jgi:hypothetical protein
MRATRRFLAALLGLLASILEFAGAFVRLGTACLERAARRLQAPSTRVASASSPPPGAPPEAPALAQATQDEKLHGALTGMGFPAPRVQKFTASVRGRSDDLGVLIKEGIVALSN